MKKIFFYGLISLFLLTSCDDSENDESTADTITYELTLSATKASQGVTTYNEIKYKNAQGELITLTDITTSFNESFIITDGFNIFIDVVGINDGPTSPDVSIGFEVKKITNGDQAVIICGNFGSGTSGSPGSWNINKSKDVTFNVTPDGETSCQ